LEQLLYLTRILKPRVRLISIIIGVILILPENVTAKLVKNFIDKSNEKILEQPYIKYNIDYTRKAFNIET
jgi:uncharacterized membrane protein (UPF0182 family)